jgi:hypothetical protein
MSRRTLLQITFAVIAFISSYLTGVLAYNYFEALFGRQSAQWQFAFCTAPLPFLLGLLSLAIALMAKPRLSKVSIGISIGVTVLPVFLFLLVIFRVY